MFVVRDYMASCSLSLLQTSGSVVGMIQNWYHHSKGLGQPRFPETMTEASMSLAGPLG